jgi:hypothetical protein
VLQASDDGKVGGTEADGPEPVQVILGPSEIQREHVVEQAETGERAFETIDGAGGGLEGGPSSRRCLFLTNCE